MSGARPSSSVTSPFVALGRSAARHEPAQIRMIVAADEPAAGAIATGAAPRLALHKAAPVSVRAQSAACRFHASHATAAHAAGVRGYQAAAAIAAPASKGQREGSAVPMGQRIHYGLSVAQLGTHRGRRVPSRTKKRRRFASARSRYSCAHLRRISPLGLEAIGACGAGRRCAAMPGGNVKQQCQIGLQVGMHPISSSRCA